MSCPDCQLRCPLVHGVGLSCCCHLPGSTSSQKWGRGCGGAQQSHVSRNLGCNLQNKRYRKQLIRTGVCWPQESAMWWFGSLIYAAENHPGGGEWMWLSLKNKRGDHVGDCVGQHRVSRTDAIKLQGEVLCVVFHVKTRESCGGFKDWKNDF